MKGKSFLIRPREDTIGVAVTIWEDGSLQFGVPKLVVGDHPEPVFTDFPHPLYAFRISAEALTSILSVYPAGALPSSPITVTAWSLATPGDKEQP